MRHNNGVSKHMIATIATKARVMMIDSCLEDSLWSEATNTALKASDHVGIPQDQTTHLPLSKEVHSFM
jgi:hypothetical protein